MRSDKCVDIAEFQWRLSAPFSTILMALLGVGLSRSSPQRGKYAKVFTAVLVFAVYYNLGAVAKSWVERGVVGLIPGIWWVQVIIVVFMLTLLWHPAKVLYWRRR